jgi:hypothetical protein
MTQQYIAGELSELLAMLQGIAIDEGSVSEIGTLRREAETRPVWTLPRLEVRALELADGMCWASLAQGDPARFEQVAAVGAKLREFGVCSGLLPDG